MSSYLDFDGVYDKTKRYIINNWSEEDFTQHFGAESAYNGDKVITTQPAYDLTIKSGEMRELGQFEAYIFTSNFVTREMYKDAKKFVGKLRESAEMAIGNRELRKPYEDKTIQEIEAGKATPFMDKLRAEIRQEEVAKLAKEIVPNDIKLPEVKVEEVKKLTK
jgi:hypothetical protein